MQEVGGLFERVGAVRDDDTGHVCALQVESDTLHQALPGGMVHVLAVELGHLLRFERLAGERRHCVDQVRHAELRGDVTHVVGGALRHAGNGAAGAKHHDRRSFVLHFS